jgi:hypothetical protein
MPLVGYEEVDALDMILGVQSVMITVNPDDDPWLYNTLWKTKDFLEGLMAEGYFE